MVIEMRLIGNPVANKIKNHLVTEYYYYLIGWVISFSNYNMKNMEFEKS